MTDPSPIHVYFLLDVSASMTGAPLESLKQGLQLLCATFIARSKRPVQIRLIGYESTPREIAALRDVQDFEMPRLEAAGSSGLGAAFRLLTNSLPEHDPALVYVFTDGEPTDDWEVAVVPLRSRVRKIFGVVCGPAATGSSINEIVDQAFQVRELTPDVVFETFRAYV